MARGRSTAARGKVETGTLKKTGLYAIVDVDVLRARDLVAADFAIRVLSARPPLLQVRAKHTSARETLDLLRALAPRCREAGTLLFANDRADLALLAGADGVHVGQRDLTVREVRAIAPSLLIGVSTHDAAELATALSERPDYVAFGPVFPTRSKANPEPVVGLAGLSRARDLALATGVPLVAIGGIDRERAPSVARLGVMGAVIGALVPDGSDPADVTERARELAAALA